MNYMKINSAGLLILTLILAGECFSYAADLCISAGGGVWHNNATGHIRYKDDPSVDIDYLNYDEENRAYAWGELTHPVPVLPNIRFEYIDIKFSDRSETGFSWEDIDFMADTYSKTSLEQIDMIAFYNVFNWKWIDCDFGLDVKYLNFKFLAEGMANQSDTRSKSKYTYAVEEENIFIPFPYINIRLNIADTGLGLECESKFIKFKNTSAYDISIKADYFFEIKPVKLGIEAGYRFEKLDIDQDDFKSIKFDADIDIDGPFAGLVLKF